jgi:hypothetical protein
MSDPVSLILVVDDIDDAGDSQEISFSLRDVPENDAFAGGSLNLTLTDKALFGRFTPKQVVTLTLSDVPAADPVPTADPAPAPAADSAAAGDTAAASAVTATADPAAAGDGTSAS